MDKNWANLKSPREGPNECIQPRRPVDNTCHICDSSFLHVRATTWAGRNISTCGILSHVRRHTKLAEEPWPHAGECICSTIICLWGLSSPHKHTSHVHLAESFHRALNSCKQQALSPWRTFFLFLYPHMSRILQIKRTSTLNWSLRTDKSDMEIQPRGEGVFFK